MALFIALAGSIIRTGGSICSQYSFKEVILLDFSGEDALFLDEHLSVSTNPFKFLSNNVVEASNSIIEFLNNNEEILDVHFIPDLLEIADKKEMTQYGNYSV